MCREELVELIERKRSLYKDQYENGTKRTSLEEEMLFKSEGEQKDVKALLKEHGDEELLLAEKITRSHKFGQKHTKGETPTLCPECYIDRDNSSTLIEASSEKGGGFRKFKCESCAYELTIEAI